jgi:DNA invertase Pin-like site-specific DNA recombinase
MSAAEHREAWAAPTGRDEVCRRASGRRHYNAVRRFRAVFRRLQVVRLLGAYGLTRRGSQAKIARELGVSRSTVCRDMAFLWRASRRVDAHRTATSARDKGRDLSE